MYDTTPTLHAVKTEITKHVAGKGTLEVHAKYVNGVKIQEVFTLESLADVMGMSMSTMEGRYARAKLHYWNTPISTRAGRPKRAFPFEHLSKVVNMLRTKHAFVQHHTNGEAIAMNPNASMMGPLVPIRYDGKLYFTAQALADYFGVSPTTIRNKLRKSGLHRRMVNLGSGVNGGRPTRAIPESAIGDVKMAVVDGVQFQSEIDRIVAGNAGRAQAKHEMSAAVDTGNVRALHTAKINAVNWNDTHPPAVAAPLAPVISHRAGGSDVFDTTDLMAQLDAWSATAKIPVFGDLQTGTLISSKPAPRRHRDPFSAQLEAEAEPEPEVDTSKWAVTTTGSGDAATAFHLDRLINMYPAAGPGPDEGEYELTMEMLKGGRATFTQAKGMIAQVKAHWAGVAK